VLLAIGLQKPSARSKAKDHKECLKRRLALWQEGKIDELIREGRAIQQRLSKGKRADPPNKAKIFANLVMNGQINSALRYLSDNNCEGVLPLTDETMKQLREKHPAAKEAKLGSLLFGPIDDVQPVIFQQIDGEMIREAALRTKGSGGPSGIDALGFRRMLACKSFKKSSEHLCQAIATLTRRLCGDLINPCTIEPIMACRLIPLDKGNGAVRPIGVGEVIRRISGKCVTKVLKGDVIEASGCLQVCAGHPCGGEAAIHAMRTIFEADDTDAVLLIDATNAFNSLNRAAALHNLRVVCPTISTYAINTYREPARLFITGGQETQSEEGTTQGDPLAMSIYALSLQPLITHLNITSSTKQCWYADDANGAGKLNDLKVWWQQLNTMGPDLGYHPNEQKCWLITKTDKEELAKDIFQDTVINVTTHGHKHLGAVIGSRLYLEEYLIEKVDDWVGQITTLAEFAASQPQACYIAYTFGLKHKWTYYLRTLPDIEELLIPLEHVISRVFIPAITDHICTDAERNLIALPVRMGGLGLENPCQTACSEFLSSTSITAPLVQRITTQSYSPPDADEVRKLQQNSRKEKVDCLHVKAEDVHSSLPSNTQRAATLAKEKGASNWLTTIPSKEMGFDLNKREFRDAVKLRYDWDISDCPTTCVCGEAFTVDHAMICKCGEFVIQRHNELRDLEAELLDMVCNDVQVEPILQDITGETLPKGSNQAPDARLDIYARGFWERQRSTFFDVRICHPNAETYRGMTTDQIYQRHEDEKKRQYAKRVLDVEQATFTPLVFTTTGGMSKECKRYHSRLAELIAKKKGEDYSTTMTWIRTKVSYSILRSALVCLRGSRGRRKQKNCESINEIDFEVELVNGEVK